MSTRKWNKTDLIVAFNLYCQLPFGKIHSRNPLIIKVADKLKRTPSALAMKMLNFASLDPFIRNGGRHGLGNASNADKAIWKEFHHDWEKSALESQRFLSEANALPSDTLLPPKLKDYTGETRRATTDVRLKQNFFRQTVLNSYQNKCCITGLDDPRLLIASHIVPWSKDKANRLNPQNGLCLSALHDKAFDKGLITVTPDLKVKVSPSLQGSKSAFCKITLLSLEDKSIHLPEKFMPLPELLTYHNNEVFIS